MYHFLYIRHDDHPHIECCLCITKYPNTFYSLHVCKTAIYRHPNLKHTPYYGISLPSPHFTTDTEAVHVGKRTVLSIGQENFQNVHFP